MTEQLLRTNGGEQAEQRLPDKLMSELRLAMPDLDTWGKPSISESQYDRSKENAQQTLDKHFGTPMIIGAERADRSELLGEPQNSSEVPPKKQNLATGDVLNRAKDGDELTMPNGEKLRVNQNGPVLLDKTGKPIDILGQTRDLDGTFSWTHNANIEHKAGSPDAQVKYKDGTEVIIKGGRIVSVQRGEITQTIKP